MIAALALALAAGGCLASVFAAYVLLLAVASAFRRDQDAAGEAVARLAVLIPAHDEETLVGRCVAGLRAQDYPQDLLRIVVIADNCGDATADNAVRTGAEVMIRTDPSNPGKGHALRWAITRLLADSRPLDAVVVVDADSVVAPGFLRELALSHQAGAEVVQADYSLLREPPTARNELVAAGFMLFHRVRLGGRERLGLPAALVGNGMLFGRRVLEAHPWDAFSPAEDLELTIRLRLAGIRPRFASRAQLAASGAASARGAMTQRVRWEGGRFHVVRTWLPRLVAASVTRPDPSLLDATLDLATPPLGLLTIFTGFGLTGTALLAAVHVVPVASCVPWLAAMGGIIAFVVVGLVSAGAPRSTWVALVRVPLFLAWKVAAYGRVARGFDVRRWERTDRLAQAKAKVTVAGVPVDVVDLEQANAIIAAAVGGGRPFQVATVNADFLVRAQRDADVMRILNRSDLNVADGMPVVWLGRLLGAPLRGRVAGADLVPAICASAARSGARVFLLGGEDGAAAHAARRLAELHPGLVVAGTFEPPRAEIEAMDNGAILRAIGESGADILLVAFGHPKQERWIDLHRAQLPVSVAVGVGCALDLVAGRRRRAPSWMQATGLEWSFRLVHEPARLFRRYAVDAAGLMPIAARVWRERRAGAAGAA